MKPVRTPSLVFGLAALCLLTVMFGHGLYQSHRQRMADSQELTDKLARALEEHTQHSFQAIDGTLRTTAAQLRSLRETGQDADALAHGILKANLATMTHARQLAILGPDGRVRHHAGRPDPAPVDLSDRDFFKAQVEQDAGLFIGAPAISRNNSAWFIGASRRLTTADGRFDGVLVAIVEPQRFRAFYKALHPGERGAVTLLRLDGALIVNEPFEEEMLSRSYADIPLFRTHLPEAPAGRFRQVASTDGVERTFSYRRVEGLPLVVVVGSAVQDTLADWWIDARRQALVWLLCAAGLSALIVLALRRGMERARALRALAESEERYRLIADNASDAVFRTRLDGTRLYVSPSVTAVLGYTPEELMSAPRIEFIHPDEREEVFHSLHSRLAASGRVVLPFRAVRKDGRVIWTETAVTLIVDPLSGQKEWIAALRDVSERKAIETELLEAKRQAEQAARAKSDFLATMSHEIRTPMNGVVGFANLLLETPLSPEQERFATHVRDAGRSLMTVINDILDFSRLEAGRLELREVPFAPRPLVESCGAIVRLAAEEKGLALHLDVADDVPARLLGDPDRIRQILLNLLGNAVKFTETGGVTVRVARQAERGAEPRVVVSVTDTGPGIPEDKQPLLFQKFGQIDRSHGGTGLGLAISRQLAEIMGGGIGVTSRAGTGSTFWFTLPLREPPAGAEAAEAPRAAMPAGAARVLVAEDLAMNRELVTRLLTLAGHAVVCAEDGAQAVEAVRRERFDLVLMDVHMPVMDGLEATRAIRALPGPAARTPILALTASALPDEVAGYRAAGMEGSIFKPVDKALLLDTVARYARTAAECDSPCI